MENNNLLDLNENILNIIGEFVKKIMQGELKKR